jgi:hypothetical protein
MVLGEAYSYSFPYTKPIFDVIFVVAELTLLLHVLEVQDSNLGQ